LSSKQFSEDHCTIMPWKRCKCGCNRSIIKGNLFGQQSSLLAPSWLPLEGFSLNSKPAVLRAWTKYTESFVPIVQKWRAFYFEDKGYSWMYLG
jgi:hypothetical protein